MNESTLGKDGQISVPISLRKAMKLRAGQRLRFEQISDREFRMTIKDDTSAGPLAALGYARKIRSGLARRTDDWVHELREGDRAS